MRLADAVWVDPERYGGVPLLKGTRIPVAQFINYLRTAGGVEQFIEEYGVEREIVERFLDYLEEQFGPPQEYEEIASRHLAKHADPAR